MKFKQSVGIVAWGQALGQKTVLVADIEEAQHRPGMGASLGLVSKRVAGIDEDTATLAVDAALDCRSKVSSFDRVGALFVGSESHPYAVKPTGTIVASSLGLAPTLAMADLQFACKAGVQALLCASAYVGSGMSQEALAIGSDCAQAKPGDLLEFTVGAGAGCFLVGSKNIKAKLVGAVSVASDTPDFWRVSGEPHPSHAGRFSGEPAYFSHITQASQLLLGELKLKPTDFTYAVFHTPNGKFPRQVAKRLGFSLDQLRHSLLVERIGNTYAAAVPIALCAVLDRSHRGERIFIGSYGSGAGADALVLQRL